tara:strand:- start:219 stop:461 length:243 start_codon:yes stop_codon:yes gene_type:complete
MELPNELWDIIKTFLFAKKFAAIETVKKHAALPYMFAMHDLKGVENNMNYIRIKNPWILDLLYVKQIENIIRETENCLRY